MKQYEIWWAEIVPPIGRRPVLLLSRTPAFQYLSKVMVAEITATVRGIPQEVLLGRQEGLRRLTRIFEGTTPRKLSRLGWCAVVGVSLATLPLLPALAQRKSLDGPGEQAANGVDDGSGAKDKKPSRPLTPDSKALLDQIEAVDKTVPTLFRDSKRSGNDINKNILTAILARLPGNRRAETFLQEIDSLVKEREKDGLAGVVLGFLVPQASPADDAKALQAMRDDLKALGVTLPAGYDPDRKEQRIFRALHLTVGTASFVVLNRKGEIAWYLADPRDLDRMIARRVIERLLAEKS